MKKFFSFILPLILILPFCACKTSSDITPVLKDITFTAELEYNDKCFECFTKINSDGKMNIEIISPDTIKGLKYSLNGNEMTSEYKGLEYKQEISSMPEGAICIKLYEILNNPSSVLKENDNYYIKGKSGAKLYLGGSGLPISAEDPKSGFKAVFKNVTLIKT